MRVGFAFVQQNEQSEVSIHQPAILGKWGEEVA